MELSRNIDGLFNLAAEAGQRALNPALLAAMLGTQVGCGRLHDADEVPAIICARNLLEADADRGSELVELADGADAGTQEIDGDLKQTRNYIAVDPQSLDPHSSDRMNELLKWHLVGFAYEAEKGLLASYDDASLVGATLSDDCSGGNFCASIAPEWDGESTFVLTDTCEYVVGIDGQPEDTFPALNEDDSE
ncbi:MAG: hypothetical protein AAB383_04050 [Patescibacteria group bacterium]